MYCLFSSCSVVVSIYIHSLCYLTKFSCHVVLIACALEQSLLIRDTYDAKTCHFGRVCGEARYMHSFLKERQILRLGLGVLKYFEDFSFE